MKKIVIGLLSALLILSVALSMGVSAAANGWVKEGGDWFYYENGVPLKNTWKADSVGWCYLDAQGRMLTNSWVMDSVGWCFVGADGYCVTNQWKQDSVGWCYLDAQGRMATNAWILDSVGWCYVGSNGYCITNQWMKDSVGWVYLNAEGRMATNRWVRDSAGWCYVGENGYCITNQWVKDRFGWCYLDANGRMKESSWLEYRGYWYYFNADGFMVTEPTVIGSETYYFDEDGKWIETPVNSSDEYTAQVKNLNGHVFRFLTSGTDPKGIFSTQSVYAETVNGDKVNDVVYARNAQLAEKYNCSIVEERYTNPGASARESLIAGDYIADFIMGTPAQIRTLASAGLILDMNRLENIDLTKSWWDQNAMEGLNVGGKTFFVTGDACTLDDRAAWILCVNRDILEQYDSSLNIYDVVKKGEWTIELMAKIMNETAKDMDGDGQITKIGTDRFGYTGERGVNWVHVASQNVTLSVLSSGGGREILATPKPELLTAWETGKSVIASPYRIVSDSSKYFKNGLSTFYACKVGTLLNGGDTTISIGFVPFPKANVEQDKYYTTVDYANIGSYCIPYTVEQAEDWVTNGFASGAEQCAYFLEAFAYYSKQILTPAFYDQVILKQTVRDAESAEMVEMALKNKVYDPVAGYDFGSLGNIFAEAGSPEDSEVGTDANYGNFNDLYGNRYVDARRDLSNYIKYINLQ